MTAKKDVVVAIMSGTFVIELLLNALMFNRAALMLGGDTFIERSVWWIMNSIAHQGPGRT